MGLIRAMGVLAVVLVAQIVTADEPGATEQPLTLKPRCGMPFQDNAILQQQIPLPIWGTSLPGATVAVTFDGQTQQATADAQGRWRVVLKPMTATKLKSVNDAPPGKTLTIICEKDGKQATTVVKNILVGEVWVAAGQSNMAGRMRTNTSRHYPADSIAKADYPAFRQFSAGSTEPWLVCSPQTAQQFGKVCFFFGRRVQQDALVPIGIIHGAVGGSRIEPWTHNATGEDGGHYRKYIEPVVGYGIRGAIWYQGESNVRDGRAYGPKLQALIRGWREAWQQRDAAAPDGPRGKFSFYFVQLPGIGTSPTDQPAQGDGRAEIRQAQFETLALPNTGMAITLDIGDVREHPPNKYDTGVRLARLVLHHDYGDKKLTPTGPLYKSHRVVGSTVRIQFDHVGDGLMIAQKQGFEPPKPVAEGTLGWLSMRDRDGTWHWAQGVIDGDELVVTSKQKIHPDAVRYAYTNHPTGPLLYNRDGLPAGPFTTCVYDSADAAAE